MKPVCPRRFEAEAMRDGRLTGVEVARFQTHLKLCPACEREVRELAALAAALRGLERDDTTQAEPDELRNRRLRTRLLAAFDADLVPARRRGLGKLALALAVALGAFGALGGLALSVWRGRTPATEAPASTAGLSLEPVRVRADGHAVWSRRFEHQLEGITLDSGTLAIRVDHAHSARRLLVVLPDGELEDVGTAFVVSVDAGRTSRVTVEEGSVILRLHGKAPLVLRAGDGWTHDAAPPVVSSVPPAARSAPAAPSAVPVATPSVLSRPRGAVGVRAAAPPPPSGSAAAASAPDLRAEDAAYLRVIALQRAGDAPAMERAARDYLRRFPLGFRRAEVERLTQ